MRFRSSLRWRRDADIGAHLPQKAKELMEEDDEETSSVAESASIDEDSVMDDEDGSHVNGIGIAH